MPHSHLPVQHLIHQVEERRSRKGPRDARPAWVADFIQRVAECFDPHDEVARVGFECRPEEDVWVVSMFLGSTEIVGGRDDGIARRTGFHFDVSGALRCFAAVRQVRWTAAAETDDAAPPSRGALLTVEGEVEGHALRLVVESVPPDDAGPGFRKYPDGRRAPA